MRVIASRNRRKWRLDNPVCDRFGSRVDIRRRVKIKRRDGVARLRHGDRLRSIALGDTRETSKRRM